MFSMQSVSFNPFIATFQLLSATSLNLGWSQNCLLGIGLNLDKAKCLSGKEFSLTKPNTCKSNVH